MLVKILKAVTPPQMETLKKDRILDLPDDLAERYIKNKYAARERVKPMASTKKKESSTKKHEEKKTKPK